MQSIGALRDLASFDRERIEHVVTVHNALRLAGNFVGMSQYYAEHAVLELLGDERHFHFAGLYEGRDEVVGAFRSMSIEIQFISAEIQTLLIDGDNAMMRTKVHVRHHGTGATHSHEIWDLFGFQQGLIVSQAKFIDINALNRLRNGRN